MSGLLALLDDVAAIAKAAAASVDDVALIATRDAAKAGAKAAGVVIDDAAVTPKYVQGIPAARELPMVWAIARGSLINKLLILLPAALLIEAFAPWLLPPLLLLGGAYLCFEGAEKVLHWIGGGHEHADAGADGLNAAHLEKARVGGAIKTDFILSAEIMTIALAAIESDGLLNKGLVLAVVGVGITVLVYGAVGLLVKADDFGLRLAQSARWSAMRAFGRGVVRGMPRVMLFIATVGTVAMLWVGGSIAVHALHELGWHAPYDVIHHAAAWVAERVPAVQGALNWLATALLDGVLGLLLGALLVPVQLWVLAPLLSRVNKA